MAHMSTLALFDHIAGNADLTTPEIEHLEDCSDCQESVVELRRVIEDSGDIEKARLYLVEEGVLPLTEEPPKEIHEGERELDETSS